MYELTFKVFFGATNGPQNDDEARHVAEEARGRLADGYANGIQSAAVHVDIIAGATQDAPVRVVSITPIDTEVPDANT